MSRTHAIRIKWIPTHPPTVLLLALLTQIGLSLLPGARIDVPWVVQLLGGTLVVFGIGLNVVASRRFERDGTSVSPSAPPTVLVTRGVFAWSRNPMYLGIALIIGGAALALATPWALLVVPPYVAWIDRLIVREEQRLDALFGDAYRAYRRRVGRWL